MIIESRKKGVVWNVGKVGCFFDKEIYVKYKGCINDKIWIDRLVFMINF